MKNLTRAQQSENNRLSHNTDDGEIWVTSFDLDAAIDFKKSIFREFEKDPKKPIIININSEGGNVTGLFLMLDAMAAISSVADPQYFTFVTACMGCAMSAGAVLLSAGGLRFASPMASVMLHQVSSGFYGSLPDVEIEYEEIKKINEMVLTTLLTRCKIKGGVEELRDLISRNKYLSAKEAKDLGIIDVIGYPKLIPHTLYEIGAMNGQDLDEPKKKSRKSNKSTSKKAKPSKSL